MTLAPVKSLLALMAVLVLASCTTQEINIQQKDPEGFAPWSDAPTPHRLGLNDRVNFIFPLTPENDQDVLVGPDGYIGLKVAGRILAQGLSVSELQEVVAAAAARRLKNPIVVATLTESRSARVIVGGAVKNPGVYTITARATVFETVMLAGGLNPESRMNEVLLVRVRADNTAMVRRINLQSFISKGDTTQNVVVEPEDMIFVPRSRVAELNFWIEEYINRNLPFGRQISYSKNQQVGAIP